MSREFYSALRAFNLGVNDRLRRGLPTIDSLTCRDFHCMTFTVIEILYHNICISGTNVSSISCLTASLELICENRDGDSSENGDDRNDDQEFGQGKAFFVVLLQVLILL